MRHELIDQRSLELNRLVAAKIHQQPELMTLIRKNLDQALADPVLSESCKDALREWDGLFQRWPLNSVLEALVEESEEGQRLRQSTPFWGVLTPGERANVFRRYEQARA